jgi:CheY-like chemotaxis protein
MTPAETKSRIEQGLKCRDDLREHWDAVMVPVSVMVVDDNASFCDLLSEQIKTVLKRKCEIKCVTTGNEAIAMLKTAKVDVLFVDLRMPKATGSGLDVLAASREIEATVVLVVTGALPDAPEIAEAIAQGHTLIIRKSELFDDLCLIFAGDGCPFRSDRVATRL